MQLRIVLDIYAMHVQGIDHMKLIHDCLENLEKIVV